jgi:hypothetical protein
MYAVCIYIRYVYTPNHHAIPLKTKFAHEVNFVGFSNPKKLPMAAKHSSSNISKIVLRVIGVDAQEQELEYAGREQAA